MSRAYHLIKMSEEEYAKYLISQMTVDMSIDFQQCKECAIVCLNEMISLNVDLKTNTFLRNTRKIIENFKT
jgi:hypothetical protein